MKFNDLDLSEWQQSDTNTDSLWVIPSRDKTGKHKNIYHGNFIPQIPNQLIRRYTKENEVVFEPFMGSGTTLFECENLGLNYIGFDINQKIIDYVAENIEGSQANKFYITNCNAMDKESI